MHKTAFLLFYCLGACVTAQQTEEKMRTIEVTGSAEMEIDPEEVIFQITIEEYWKEEFEGKEWEEYRSKVSIDSIESSLVAELLEQGVTMKMITLVQTGNFWRHRGKDFLVRKTLQISLDNYAMANSLSNELKTRGIQGMYVQELKHSQIEKYKLECKSKALLNAREKANAILAVLGESVDNAVRIVEVDQHQSIYQKDYAMMRSASAEQAPVEYENFKKISISADLRVVFSIKTD